MSTKSEKSKDKNKVEPLNPKPTVAMVGEANKPVMAAKKFRPKIYDITDLDDQLSEEDMIGDDDPDHFEDNISDDDHDDEPKTKKTKQTEKKTNETKKTDLPYFFLPPTFDSIHQFQKLVNDANLDTVKRDAPISVVRDTNEIVRKTKDTLINPTIPMYLTVPLFKPKVSGKNVNDWIYRHFPAYYEQRGLSHVLYTCNILPQDMSREEAWSYAPVLVEELKAVIEKIEDLEVQFMVFTVEFTPSGAEKIIKSEENKLTGCLKKKYPKTKWRPRYVYKHHEISQKYTELIRVFSNHDFNSQSLELVEKDTSSLAETYLRLIKFAVDVVKFQDPALFAAIPKFEQYRYRPDSSHDDFQNLYNFFTTYNSDAMINMVYYELAKSNFIEKKIVLGDRYGYPHIHAAIFYNRGDLTRFQIENLICQRVRIELPHLIDDDAKQRGRNPGSSGNSTLNYVFKEWNGFYSTYHLGKNPVTYFNVSNDPMHDMFINYMLHVNRMSGYINGLPYVKNAFKLEAFIDRWDLAIKKSKAVTFGDPSNLISFNSRSPTTIAIYSDQGKPLHPDYSDLINRLRRFMHKKRLAITSDHGEYPMCPSIVMQQKKGTKMTWGLYRGGSFETLWVRFVDSIAINQEEDFFKYKKQLFNKLENSHQNTLPKIYMDQSWIEFKDCYFYLPEGIITPFNEGFPCHQAYLNISLQDVIDIAIGDKIPKITIEILENSGYVYKDGIPRESGRNLINVLINAYRQLGHKVKTPFLDGPGSCGKSVLARILAGMTSTENMGFIANSDGFSTEPIMGKSLGLYEEFYEARTEKTLKMLEIGSITHIEVKGKSGVGKTDTKLRGFSILTGNSRTFALTKEGRNLERGMRPRLNGDTPALLKDYTNEKFVDYQNRPLKDNLVYDIITEPGAAPAEVDYKYIHTGIAERLVIFPFRTLQIKKNLDLEKVIQKEAPLFALWQWHHYGKSTKMRKFVNDVDVGIVPMSGITLYDNIPKTLNVHTFYIQNRRWLHWMNDRTFKKMDLKI